MPLRGKITQTDCPGIPDAGCSITVDGYKVQIVHGFSNTPDLGTLTGYKPGEVLIGKTATIYGKITSSNTIDIFSNQAYYVHID